MIKKINSLALLSTIVFVGCNNSYSESSFVATTQSICNNKSLAGGWSKKQISPQSQEALDFALVSMDSDAKLVKVLSVYSQVVNGINYAIEFEIDNSEIYNTIVYQTFDGELSLVQPVRRGQICP